jgi:hypothetical protein
VLKTTQNLNIYINGRSIPARFGQSVAAALWAAGRTTFRHSPTGQPRGPFCGIGVCFECMVIIDDVPGQRACMIPVRPDMRVVIPQESSDAGD